MWILALAAARYPIDVGDYVVDDLSINTIHGFEGSLVARLQSLLGNSSSEVSQGRSPTGADTTHIDADLSFTRATTGSLQHRPYQFVYGLGCSTSSTYKQSYSFSISFNPHDAVLDVMPGERQGNAERVCDPADERLRKVGLLQERRPCVLIHHWLLIFLVILATLMSCATGVRRALAAARSRVRCRSPTILTNTRP